MKLGENESLPLLLEDFLIFKLCPLEESASHQIVTDLIYQWSDWEHGVYIGICVENGYIVNREFLIWIRFDNMRLGEKGSLFHLREDPLISDTCPREESASHHDSDVHSNCVHPRF